MIANCSGVVGEFGRSQSVVDDDRAGINADANGIDGMTLFEIESSPRQIDMDRYWRNKRLYYAMQGMASARGGYR